MDKFLRNCIILLLLARLVLLSDDIGMTIVPSGYIVRRVNDELNLTCRVKTEDKVHKFLPVWMLPIKVGSDKSRITIYKTYNEISVNIQDLQEEDSGVYSCEVNSTGIVLNHNVRVFVKAGKEKCSEQFFPCGGGICIPRRYVCDGFADCPSKADESTHECGQDPCEGKILCDDGRCIPKQKCCDHTLDPDCPIVYTIPCCHKYINQDYIGSPTSSVQQHHYSDINFLQSTIYTIVSCAIAFIFITTIMVVAICRIHMRRSVMSLSSRRNPIGNNRRLLRWPWYLGRLRRRGNENSENPWQTRCQIVYPNLENEETLLDTHQYRTQIVPYSCSLSTHGSFIVTYSNSDGVQLVEHLPKPPPYTESSDSTVHLSPFSTNGIPPPPYRSVEDLPAINGSQSTLSPPEINSTENDQVIVVHMTSSNVPSLRLEETL
ncbi:low-density lipoprotein receptor class A domain-containing protein 3-like [Centruroides sculpturatus]|uniref:low-density lipoprotein receptor class A domain-containing protein 3-like n=1 Tax=Centruroides sculpturatus TaxID=218467 RepID=UPI000C6E44FF|nr:low-density lipoprotein receptor class A domain-containing protein 3-like [Centruroides sculpturatus]